MEPGQVFIVFDKRGCLRLDPRNTYGYILMLIGAIASFLGLLHHYHVSNKHSQVAWLVFKSFYECFITYFHLLSVKHTCPVLPDVVS